jgi:hypothetical protein
MPGSTKQFMRLLDNLLENAPNGISDTVLEHLSEARDAMEEDSKEGISPGQMAAHEASGKDPAEDKAEGEAHKEELSPGQREALAIAEKEQS